MRRALVFLFILLISVAFAENVAADFLFVGEVTSDGVTLSWEIVWNVEMYILYRDDGEGWGYQDIFHDSQTSEYKVTGLEPEKTYRFKLRYCMDLGCGDSADSNVVEVTTKETPSDPLPVILAVVSVIVSIVVVVLIALRRRRTKRD